MDSRTNQQENALQHALEWLVTDKMLADVKRHGNTKWCLKSLIFLGLFWAWGMDNGLIQRFQLGLAILQRWSRSSQKLTYQGFIKRLRIWSGRLLPILSDGLRQRIQELSDDQGRVAGHVVMAIDGTRVEVPRTRDNEEWFSRIHTPRSRARKPSRQKPSRRKKVTLPSSPQIWLTVLWNVTWGLLWDWRQGPGRASERAHLLEMLGSLPEKTLLVADAGFQGYEYWQELLKRGHSFLIRVAGQVRLLKGLGFVRQRANLVYLWPEKCMRRHQPPLVLRICEFHDGRNSLWLVTNLLEEAQLSRKQMSDIYRQRWGIELFFRTFKQTFGRGKLRSHAPQNAELELDWSLLALMTVELWSTRELLARGESVRKRSTAAVLRTLQHGLHLAAWGIDFPLLAGLAALSDDGYQRRCKSIRRWPRKKQHDKTGAPQIRSATSQERNIAKQLKAQTA